MFEKINTSFVSSDCCSCFLNVCVVIAGCHNHIIKGWWKSYWELLNPVQLLSQVYIYFIYSSDIITCYYVPHVYNCMSFVYVIKLLLILYLVH